MRGELAYGFLENDFLFEDLAAGDGGELAVELELFEVKDVEQLGVGDD